MIIIKQVFEEEGLIDEFDKLSHKNLMHVEEILKFSRDAFVPENTVVFGSVNRLQLIKNKMKNNSSFNSNVTSVDIRKLGEWVRQEIDDIENNQAEPVEESEDSTSVTDDESVADEEPEVEDNVEEEPEAEEEPQPEESSDEKEPSCTGKFKYEYLVETTPISTITAGFSSLDYSPKEFAHAFIKRLRAC